MLSLGRFNSRSTTDQASYSTKQLFNSNLLWLVDNLSLGRYKRKFEDMT